MERLPEQAQSLSARESGPRKLDTVSAWETLAPMRARFSLSIIKGCHLGFRKMSKDTAGTWQARCRRPDGELDQTALGALEGVLRIRSTEA